MVGDPQAYRQYFTRRLLKFVCPFPTPVENYQET